ncbi:major facilitator superfamily domain-containing protein [Aspergillus californicus]
MVYVRFHDDWAVVSTLTCLVKNYHQMLVCRLLLGVVEAPFYPGALSMIALYNRKEATTRMTILYTGYMLASSFSGLISAALTVAVAVTAIFLLPNSPKQTLWLTPEERQLAHDCIARDTTQKVERTSIFVLMCNLHLSANGFKNFMLPVVETLGFNSTITLVLTCPPYLLATFTSIAVSWSLGYFNERTWHITVSKLLAIVGFALATGTLNVGARYFAMILFVAATYGVNNINIAWVGRRTGFSAGVVILSWIMRLILARDNKKLRAADLGVISLYTY